MGRWVGRTEGDHRVICMNTEKIYSCPRGASLDTNISEDTIIANCNKYLQRADKNGLVFKWYAQYKVETSKDLWVLPTPPRTIKVFKVTSHRERLRASGRTLKSYRARVAFFYKFIIELMDEYEVDDLDITVTDLLDRIKEMYVKQYGDNYFSTTPSAFVRHVEAHLTVYKKILGLRFKTMYSDKNRRMTKAVSLRRIPNITEANIYVYDDELSYHHRATGSAIPVIRLNDYKVFHSLSVASEITGVPRPNILYCCEGDIATTHKFGMDMEFAYVKFVEDRKEADIVEKI